MDKRVATIYERLYDNSERGDNGHEGLLGTFTVIQQLVEDTYEDTFIGLNQETGEVCLVQSFEVCGIGGGMRYEVFPLKDLKYTGE